MQKGPSTQRETAKHQLSQHLPNLEEVYLQCRYICSTHNHNMSKNIAIFIVDDSEQISQWFISVFEVIWQILILLALMIKDVWIGKAVVYPGLLAWPRCLVVKISIYIAFFDVIHSPVVKQWMHDIELKWRGWKSDAKWYRAHWYFGLYVQIIRLKYNVYSFSGLNIVYLCTFLIC